MSRTLEARMAEMRERMRLVKERRAGRKTRSLKVIESGGWVYVIGLVGHRYIKIGMTGGDNPLPRIEEIGRGLPFELNVLGLARSENVCALEYELHSYFSEYRVRGEWFDLTADQVESIFSLWLFHKPNEAISLYRTRILQGERLR